MAKCLKTRKNSVRVRAGGLKKIARPNVGHRPFEVSSITKGFDTFYYAEATRGANLSLAAGVFVLDVGRPVDRMMKFGH